MGRSDFQIQQKTIKSNRQTGITPGFLGNRVLFITQNEMEALASLVTTLELQKDSKRDLVVPSHSLGMTTAGGLYVNTDGMQEYFNPNRLCESQIAEKLGIPSAYYQKMKSSVPTMLSQNVNGWLEHTPKKQYLVRAFANPEQTGIARAFLSDRYNIIDNYDVLFAALDAIQKTGVKVEITKAEVTENRMYLHVTCPEIELAADEFLREYLKENDAAGNGIISGFVISNSEVGAGTFEIRPRAVICKCNNGLVVKDDRFRKYHLGAQMGAGEIVWSERTKRKNYELIISQTQDAVKTFLSKDYLGRMVEKIAEAHKIELKHPIDAVQNVCTHLRITEDHKANILNYFLKDGVHKAGGIFQAVTREAQNMDADTQHDIEMNITELMPKILKFDKPFSKN